MFILLLIRPILAWSGLVFDNVQLSLLTILTLVLNVLTVTRHEIAITVIISVYDRLSLAASITACHVTHLVTS